MYCEGYLNKFALIDLHLVMPNEIQAFSSYSIVLLGTGRGAIRLATFVRSVYILWFIEEKV